MKRRGDIPIISYKPFYETLFKQGRTEYDLIYHHGISSHILYRMKQGKPITTTTLDTLCFVLNCNVSDILSYVYDDTREAKKRTKDEQN